MFSAVYELLHGIVDYAGLFPPAKLPLERVVDNFSEYISGNESWMLGRLIVPVKDLHSLPSIAKALANSEAQSEATPESRKQWRISSLLSSAEPQQLRSDVQKLNQFNEQYRTHEQTAMVVDAVEVKAATPDGIHAIAATLPPQIETFIEVPLVDTDTSALIKHIANHETSHLRAKIRTGGIYAELIPPVEVVAAFIKSCAMRAVPFKATAGLHHPVRGEQALTYDQQSNRATMHGFLNVLLATAMLFESPQSKRAMEVLSETDPNPFVPSDAGWLWRGHEITLSQIQHARKSGMLSFGSCSFIEPAEDLEGLGIQLDSDKSTQA